MERQQDDAEDRVDRDDAEHAEHDVAEQLLAAGGGHRFGSRSTRRVIGERDHEDQQREHDRHRRGEPDAAGGERVLVHEHGRHGRRRPGAAVGRDVDQVERAQGEDRRERQRHRELAAHAGQRHREELAHTARAVHARRLVQRERHLLDAGQEHHEAEAEHHPGADQAERGQRGVEVAEPAAGERAQADRPQELVERAGRRVDPHPRERDDDRRDRLRHEQHGAEERHAAHARVRDQRREDQPERGRQDRVEEDQHERVDERRADARVVEDLPVVVEPGPRADGQPVPVEERQPRRVDQRAEREQQVEDHRRRQVQVGHAPGLTRRADPHSR